MILADMPDLTPIEEAMQATLRVMQEHERVCPGCQHRMACPVYSRLVREERERMDAACRTLLGTT